MLVTARSAASSTFTLLCAEAGLVPLAPRQGTHICMLLGLSKAGPGSWKQLRMAGGSLAIAGEGQLGFSKNTPLQSHPGCCKGRSNPQPGHHVPDSLNSSLEHPKQLGMMEYTSFNPLCGMCSWLGCAHQEQSSCLTCAIFERHVMTCMLLCFGYCVLLLDTREASKL